MNHLSLIFGIALLAIAHPAEADEPKLPDGLGEAGEEPDLPDGLDEGEEHDVPEGLGDEGNDEFEDNSDEPSSLLWNASIDVRGGGRLPDDPYQKRASLGELRLRIDAEQRWDTLASTLRMSADFVYDPILDEHDIDIESGQGFFSVREMSLVMSPLSFVDIKVGRQILTWGTGDLVFVNDMFPKDWNAFLIGRELEYLKAPSDAIKLAIFHDLANLEVIYTPRFDGDRFPDRRRLSSWDPLGQSIVGRQTPIVLNERTTLYENAEWAARLYRTVAGYELAAYAYRGYWKSPAGFSLETGEVQYPPLSVFGLSGRRALLGGIGNLEAGYYDSRTDRSGTNPLIRNSEVRGLMGFDTELFSNFKLGLQYYWEYTLDHLEYVTTLPAQLVEADQTRHMITLRLHYLARNQSLQLGVFSYLSPNDRDLAVLPDISYAYSDVWTLGLGARIMAGTDDHTFFGQLQSNSNVYLSAKAAW